MAGAALDAGLDHLKGFNALLGETNDRLRADVTALEAHEEDVGRLAERVEDQVGEVVGAVVEAGERADGTQRDVIAAAEALAERAGDAGGRRLPDLGMAIESLERAVEERGAGSRATLGGDADRVEHDGFDPLGEALENANIGVGAADHETGLAFDDLTGALEALDVRLLDLRFDTHTAFQEAGERLEDEDAKGLEEVRSACTVEWSGVIDDSLRGPCADLGDEMEALYDACLGEVEAEGKSLVAGAAALLKAAAREAVAGQAAALADRVALARSDGFDALLAEVDALLSLMDAEQGTGEAVPPLVDDLEAATAVVDDIEKMLEELAR